MSTLILHAPARHAHAAILLAVAVSALPAWSAPTVAQGPMDARAQAAVAVQMQRAGQRLGVPVRTTRMVYFAQHGATFLTAPAANLERIPATELPRGIDLGVAYLDAPRQDIPAGYYRLRVFAEPRGVGTVEGRLQWIGAGGRVAAEVPATIEVESMTLPARAATEITDVTITTVAAKETQGCLYKVKICHLCTNGQYTCWYTCIWKAQVQRNDIR